MDFTNVSVNEFIRYFVKQNRKVHGYDWFEDRKQSPQTAGFVFEPASRAVHSATIAKPAIPGKAEIASSTGLTDTEELEIW